jgi:hypothetical protein
MTAATRRRAALHGTSLLVLAQRFLMPFAADGSLRVVRPGLREGPGRYPRIMRT